MADYSRNHFIASSPSDTFPLEDEAPARVHRARTRRACGTERSHGHARRAAAATPAHEGSRRANARHATQPSDRRARTSGRRTGLDRFAKGVVVAAVLALGIATVPAVAQGTTLPDLLTNTVAMLTSTQEEVIESHKVTEGVEDPDGTTITLFDYWDDDSHKDGDDYLGAAYSSTVRYEGGINYDDSTGTRNQLEFNQGGHGNIDLSINSSGTALRQKLVQGVLGDDGYPVLGGLGTLGSSYRDGNGSAITQKSLAYLFNSNDEDTETQVKGKEVYENAKGLLQVDDEGYYYYNSRENFASYNEETGSFDLYDAPAVYPYGNSGLGQFFPFDDATEVFDGTVSNGTLNAANVNSVASTATGSTAKLNHWFGLNMTTQFTQTNNGIASTGDDVTFEFSGDDDVWVFIDGVLVGDMGGIHSARSLTINFKTGEVNADGTTTTIRECFANAAETYSAQGYTYDESDFSGDTFANNTVHTLQFYYLERGNWDSNMSLKFNLTNSPLNGAEKVDENGNGIGGVTFGLYPADENHQPIDNDNPAMTVETSDDGTVSFVNEDGTPMTFAELYTKYKTEHYVVRELDTPDGYRTIDGDIRVRYDHDTGAIYCENSWETGVFGATGEIVTAPTTMQLTNDATGETYNATLSTGGDAGLTLTSSDGTSSSGGILFATVLHQSNDGTWHAVYGTREEGDWSTTESSTEEYAAVLDAITEVLDHNERGAWLFNKTEDNQYEAEIKELPGDVSGYRSVNENGKFMLQMYYSTASSLSEVNASNLYKVKSLDEGKGSNGATFTRQFAAIFKVPNIHNHLVVQKLDEDGNAISATSTSDVMSAEFSLYRKDDVTLNDDGTYEIHEGATAYMTAKTYDRDADDALAANAQGVASFDGIAAGDYVLIETKAPQGYAAGEYASHVYVDNSGVYVNAGSATDGIAVHRDIGQLVSTMKQFATDTNLDNTLTYVTAQLQTSNDDACLTDGTLWQDVEGASQVLKFNNASSNNALDYSVVEGKFPLTAESG